jgi:hypothetical protein
MTRNLTKTSKSKCRHAPPFARRHAPDAPCNQLWRRKDCLANDSSASLRRYQKMNYAPDKALGIPKNFQAYVIV